MYFHNRCFTKQWRSNTGVAVQPKHTDSTSTGNWVPKVRAHVVLVVGGTCSNLCRLVNNSMWQFNKFVIQLMVGTMDGRGLGSCHAGWTCFAVCSCPHEG